MQSQTHIICRGASLTFVVLFDAYEFCVVINVSINVKLLFKLGCCRQE